MGGWGARVMPTAPPGGEFQMHGARAAMALGLFHIEEQVKGIERAVLENPSLTFDLAKTLVESACKTILTERSLSFDSRDDLPKLFRAVTRQLPLLPASASGEIAARKSLTQILSGLHTAMQGVAALRNAYGFASHGSDGARPAMAGLQAILAAEAADAIVGFLYGVHRDESAVRSDGPLAFEGNEDFNDWVDASNEVVRIFDFEFRPSEVLFLADRDAYGELLTGYGEDTVIEDEDDADPSDGPPLRVSS